MDLLVGSMGRSANAPMGAPEAIVQTCADFVTPLLIESEHWCDLAK